MAQRGLRQLVSPRPGSVGLFGGTGRFLCGFICLFLKCSIFSEVFYVFFPSCFLLFPKQRNSVGLLEGVLERTLVLFMRCLLVQRRFGRVVLCFFFFFLIS